MNHGGNRSVSSPTVLNDPARLAEVYRLRTLAWERSPDGDIINTKLYPDGWTDLLDETATHWIVCNEQGQIISSSRLNILEDINEVFSICEYTAEAIEISKPFAYISRLVTHPDYRGVGLSHSMDAIRIQYAVKQSLGSMVVLAGDLGMARFRKLGFRERLSFLNKAYKVNPRSAHSHLMILDLPTSRPVRSSAC